MFEHFVGLALKGLMEHIFCKSSKKLSNFQDFLPFKRQTREIVNHTQKIRRFLPTNCLSVFDRRLLPTNCLNVFDHFVGLALKRLRVSAK